MTTGLAWCWSRLGDVNERLRPGPGAPADGFDAAGRILDFEYAPDIRTCADMAEADPSCVRP